MYILTTQLQLPLDANNETNWFNWKIRKCNAKFDTSFVWQVAEMLAVSPHFHGQFATCGNWRQGYPHWPQTKSNMLLWLPCLYYWLLLRSDIVQSVPCTAVIFWSIVRSHLKSNLSWFIHQSSLLAAETHSSEAGSWREMFLNLADEISLSYSAVIFNMP
jgi:hypothetical protein